MPKNDADVKIGSKIDHLEKAMKQNMDIIKSLQLGQQFLINEFKHEKLDDVAEMKTDIVKKEIEKRHGKEVHRSLVKSDLLIEALKDKLADYQSKTDNYDIMKQQLTEFRDSVNHIRQQFNTLKEELTTKTEDLLALQAKYDDAVFNLDKETSKSRVLAQKLALLENDFSKKSKDYDELMKEFANLKTTEEYEGFGLKDIEKKYKEQSEKLAVTDAELQKTKNEFQSLKKDNEVLIHQIVAQGHMIKTLRDEKVKVFNTSEKKAAMKKRILQQNIQINSMKIRENSLKDLIKKKDSLIKNHIELLKEKDEKIKILAEQQDLIRQEVKNADQANSFLQSGIHDLRQEILELKDSYRKLTEEKQQMEHDFKLAMEVNEKTAKKRLRELAEAESRREVVLNVKIQELKELVKKQKGVIEKREYLLGTFMNSLSEEVKSIDFKGENLDYAALEDDSELMAAKEKALDIEAKEEVSEVENIHEDLFETVRNALQNGEQDEIIINSLKEQGFDESLITEAIKKEKLKLHMDTE